MLSRRASTAASAGQSYMRISGGRRLPPRMMAYHPLGITTRQAQGAVAKGPPGRLKSVVLAVPCDICDGAWGVRTRVCGACMRAGCARAVLARGTPCCSAWTMREGCARRCGRRYTACVQPQMRRCGGGLCVCKPL